MILEELEQFVRVHQSAIAQHQEWLTQHETAKIRHDQQIEAIRALQETNAQQLNNFTAELLQLRNLAADYIQGRSEN
jgi:phosphoketolase